MQNLLLFIEANTTGTGMIALQTAKALGFSPVFLTNNPHRYHNLDQMDCPVLVCDTNSVETLLHTITTSLEKEDIRGVTTTSDFYVEIVARISIYLGKAGNNPDAIRACRNKAEMRNLLRNAGIKQPRFSIIRSIEDISLALTFLPPPWIVKPVSDTGSNNVCLRQNAKEVTELVERILMTETNVRGQPCVRQALIEEYVIGPEYSVEMISRQGEAFCIGITEKKVEGFPFFVEQRHIFPAPLSQTSCEEINQIVVQALAIVGITHGATHTEVKLTAQGCVIIEINARLAGGMIPELVRCAYGTDLLEQQLKMAVIEVPDLRASHERYAGIHFLLSKDTGRFVAVEGIEGVRAMPGIKMVTITAYPEMKVQPARNAYDRLGYVIASAETYEEVVNLLLEAEAKLSVQALPLE